MDRAGGRGGGAALAAGARARGGLIAQAQLDAGIQRVLNAIDKSDLAQDLKKYKTEIVTLQGGFDLSKRYSDVAKNQEWQTYYNK